MADYSEEVTALSDRIVEDIGEDIIFGNKDDVLMALVRCVVAVLTWHSEDDVIARANMEILKDYATKTLEYNLSKEKN